MSGGTGIDPLDQFLNINSQILTAGAIGYGKDGVTPGVTGKVALNGVKEITGANAAEEANNIAKDQFQASLDQAAKSRSDAQLANQNQQIAASNAAGSAKTIAPRSTTSKSQVIGDTTDFLGL